MKRLVRAGRSLLPSQSIFFGVGFADAQLLALLSRRRSIHLAGVAAYISLLLTACVGISETELQRIGAKVTPENINFGEVYTYAERASAAYAAKSVILVKYPRTVRINAPSQTDIRYFLERNDKARTQFISIRGTANNVNFSEDLDIAVREDRKIAIPVHAGFDRAARAIYADVSPSRAVLRSVPGVRCAPGSCPAGLVAEVGLRWWRQRVP